MTVVKSLFILVSLLTLAACGGGGGSSNSNEGKTPAPATLTLVSTPASAMLTEHETVALTFTLQGIEGTLSASVEYDYLPENSSIETTINDSTITVNIDVGNELMHNSVSNFTVTIEDERTSANQTVSWSEQIIIENTSGDGTYTRYIDQKGAAEAYALLLPEQKFIGRLVKLSALTNPDSNDSSRNSLFSRINAVSNNTERADELTVALEALDNFTAKYIAGEVDENEMINIQGPLDIALTNYSYDAHIVIQDAIKATEEEVAGYDYQGAVYSDISQTFSSFIGNTSLGAYEDGNWLFKDEYAFLEPVAYPELETCNAE